MKNIKNQALLFATIYTFLILIIASIPFYFYVKLAIKHSKIIQSNQLFEYSEFLKEKIYALKSKDFIYPTSFLFESAIFDENKKVIASTLSHKIDSFNLRVWEEKGYLFLATTLKPNAIDAKYLICAKKLEFDNVLKELLAITLIFIVALFISNYLVLSMSIKPYDRLNRLQEEFFDDAMHELKTPLGILRLNIEMLKNRFGENKNLIRANGAITTLTNIYEDLEYLLKNKSTDYKPEPVDLSIFLKERCELFLDLAISKEIKLECNINDKAIFNINRMELSRIIDNNLSNAIKYSHKGGLVIVSLIVNQKEATLEFKDFGAGIKDTQKIFLRHYKEDEVKGGFGIGLSIVKKICDKYGIKIEVLSEINKGSVFRYIFNLQ